jgi:N-dimethylarginine dimethylaminohydrolase
MGILQFVDRDLAIVRGQLLSSGFVEYLRGFGMYVVSLDETASITRGLAMNFVTVAPRKIVMAVGNPGTKSLLEDNGIEVVEELEVSELIKGVGGIGCTTGILHRDLIEL